MGSWAITWGWNNLETQIFCNSHLISLRDSLLLLLLLLLLHHQVLATPPLLQWSFLLLSSLALSWRFHHHHHHHHFLLPSQCRETTSPWKVCSHGSLSLSMYIYLYAFSDHSAAFRFFCNLCIVWCGAHLCQNFVGLPAILWKHTFSLVSFRFSLSLCLFSRSCKRFFVCLQRSFSDQ